MLLLPIDFLCYPAGFMPCHCGASCLSPRCAWLLSHCLLVVAAWVVSLRRRNAVGQCVADLVHRDLLVHTNDLVALPSILMTLALHFWLYSVSMQYRVIGGDSLLLSPRSSCSCGCDTDSPRQLVHGSGGWAWTAFSNYHSRHPRSPRESSIHAASLTVDG